MPTYEYECLKCKKRFEFFQSMKDEPLTHCVLDGCKGKVKRLLSAGSGLIFKGSGFYATDYKKPGAAAPSAKKAEDASPALKSESCPSGGSCPAAAATKTE
jgi:putative FmdB family regulatory protein